MGKRCPWILVFLITALGNFILLYQCYPDLLTFRISHLHCLSVTCEIQSNILTTTYRLSWFGSDLLLLQPFVWPASTPPPTHTAPDIRSTLCFLDTPCSFMLLYLAKWLFLLLKWFSHLFPFGKIPHTRYVSRSRSKLYLLCEIFLTPR